MKAIDSLAYLVLAGVIVVGSSGSRAPVVHGQQAGQSGQSQSQTDSRSRQFQQQPPRINTDQEWKAAVEFMQTYCPNRFNFFSHLSRPMQVERAKEFILKHYRQISSIKDVQIHDNAVAQARVEDEVFGAQIKAKDAAFRNDPRAILEANNELRNAEEKKLVVQVALRQLRIARLQAEIDRFKNEHQKIVANWVKEDLKNATSAGADVEQKIGDADIDSTPPTNPPTTKK